MAIHIPRRRLLQPSGAIEAHPEWESRLASLIHFGSGRPIDVVDRSADYSYSGSPSSVNRLHGVGLKVGVPATPGYAQTSGGMAGWSGQSTLVFFLPEVGPCLDGSGSMLYSFLTDASYTMIRTDRSSLHVLGYGGSIPLGENISGTTNRSLVMRAVDGDPAVFLDRKKVSGVARSVEAGAKTVRLGAWTSSGYQFDGVYGSVAVVKGALSDDEAIAWVDYPYLAYRTAITRIYSFPAGAIPTLNSLTMSAFTSSGARATLGITR